MIDELIKAYLECVVLSPRGRGTVQHVANAWRRRAGTAVDDAAVVRFRANCVADGLSARTIESQISRVIGYCRVVGVPEPKRGRRLSTKPIAPTVPEMTAIGAVYAIADQSRWRSCDWWHAMLAVSLWTGLRIGDLRLIEWGDVKADRIERVANKTGKRHVYPIPHEVSRLLKNLPHTDATIFALKPGCVRFARRELARLCEVAAVPKFGFQMVRRASVTEWSACNADAGAIIHGTGLGVRAYYIDPLTVLRRAADQFCWPEQMRDRDTLAQKRLSVEQLERAVSRLGIADIERLRRMAEVM